MPSHYLNQCWSNWILRNKYRWNFNQNTELFIHENASEMQPFCPGTDELKVWQHPDDDWENIYTLSYHHHQIGSMNYYPLFRVRSWNNGVRCMSFYILIMSVRQVQVSNVCSRQTPICIHIICDFHNKSSPDKAICHLTYNESFIQQWGSPGWWETKKKEAWTKQMLFYRQHVQMHFLQKNICILIKISLKFIPKGQLTINWHWFRQWYCA